MGNELFVVRKSTKKNGGHVKTPLHTVGKSNKTGTIVKFLPDDTIFKNSNIIMTTVVHEKESILSSGADLYLPKPYEIPFLFEWVERLMNKYNS